MSHGIRSMHTPLHRTLHIICAGLWNLRLAVAHVWQSMPARNPWTAVVASSFCCTVLMDNRLMASVVCLQAAYALAGKLQRRQRRCRRCCSKQRHWHQRCCSLHPELCTGQARQIGCCTVHGSPNGTCESHCDTCGVPNNQI